MDTHLTEIPITKAGAVEVVRIIAKQRNISFYKAAHSEAGQYILKLAEQLPPDPPQAAEKAAQDAAPDYLVQAAQQIAKRDSIPIERAYGRISRERPELAKRYRRETT
jgi:hypothetical protein